MKSQRKKPSVRTGSSTKFASKYEERIYFNSLDLGINLEYETEKLDYEIPAIPKKYTPDFIIIGTKKKIYVEAKGYFTSADRTKMLRVRDSNPDLDIRFLFMENRRIRKNSTTYYSDWAVKNGFKYSIGSCVPVAWWEEVKSKRKPRVRKKKGDSNG